MNQRLRRIAIRLAIGIGVPLAVVVGIALVSNQGNTTTPPSSTSYPSGTLGNTPVGGTSVPTAQSSTSSVVSQEGQLCGGQSQAGTDGASASCKIILTNSNGSTDSFIVLFDASGNLIPDPCQDDAWTTQYDVTWAQTNCGAPLEPTATAKADCLSATGTYFPTVIEYPRSAPLLLVRRFFDACSEPLGPRRRRSVTTSRSSTHRATGIVVGSTSSS